MVYEMDGRQVKLCEGNLMITSGRFNQKPTEMDTAMDENHTSKVQKKMDSLVYSPKQKNSKPYIPPHRRSQVNGYPDNINESRQRDLQSYTYTYNTYDSFSGNSVSKNSSDYTESKPENSVYYKNKDLSNGTNSNQKYETNPKKSDQSMNKILDFQKNFFLVPNGTHSSNQVEDNTCDTDQIVERVMKLVDTHVNNGLKEILDGLYEQEYGETLPPGILNRWKFSVTLKNERPNLVSNGKVSEPTKQVQSSEIKRVPESLDVSKLGKEFWMNIFNCKNVTELWGMVMDGSHYGKVEKLTEQMESFYGCGKKSNIKIVNDSYYALFDGSWHRVKCLQCNDTEATVLFIDRGDMDKVPTNQLHELSPQFCTLPAQAIRISLSGLEVFSDYDKLQPILDKHLFERSAFVEVNKVIGDYLDVTLSLNGENGTFVDVNEMIQGYVLFDPKDHMQTVDVVPAYISNIEKGIYIQLDVPSLKYYILLVDKAIEQVINENHHPHMVIKHERNKVYFVKNSKDEEWYRGKIIKFTYENEAEVYLIDVGLTIEVDKQDIISLDKICPVLAKYPAQAIRVQLDQIPYLSSGIMTKFQNIISKIDILYVKFVTLGSNNNLPSVVFMKKNDGGFLMSINDALLLFNDDKEPNKTADTIAFVPSVQSTQVTRPNNRALSTSSVLSRKSSEISKFDSSKTGDTIAFVSSNQSMDASSNKALSTSSVLSRKTSEISKLDSSKTGDTVAFVSSNQSMDASSNKALSTSSVLSRKSSENSKLQSNKMNDTIAFVQSKQLMGISSNKAFSTSSVLSTKSSEYSILDQEIEQNVPLKIDKNRISKIREMNRSKDNSKSIMMHLSSILRAPKVPEDDYFDVHVTMSSDPSHFVIQLLRDKTLGFNKMICKMSETCRSYNGPMLTCESIKVGHLYACRSSERNNRDWCRVYVTDIKDKKIASVYCCDYGSYKNIDISDMVPLDNEYYGLPYQAIWAELNGVKPTSKEWTVRACLKFQELTQSKNFVGRVKCKKDMKSQSLERPSRIPVTVETIYSLELIDTGSSTDDIDIAELLIKEGVAEKC